jgi:hypothetical protein
MDQVIYREEVLTIMGLLGDVREELQRIRRALTDKMAKGKKRRNPDEAAELAAFDARSAENLRGLRELTDGGGAELEVKRAAAARGDIELDPAWESPP